MERQGVTNAMRDVVGGGYTPRLDLDPVAVALIDDWIVQVEQRFKAEIIPHGLLYHQVINDASRPVKRSSSDASSASPHFRAWQFRPLTRPFRG